MIAKTLRKIAATVLLLSLAVYAVAAMVGVSSGTRYDVADASLGFMAGAVVASFVSIALFGLSWLIEWRAEQRKPSKPRGWNVNVLWWFHNGPERRVPSKEFREAFAERLRQTADEDPESPRWGQR